MQRLSGLTCFKGALGKGAALLVLAAFASAGAMAQATAPAGPAEAAVLVNGPAGPLTRIEMESMVNDMVPPNQRASFWAQPDAVAQFARNLYSQRMLAADALKAGVENTPQGAAYLKMQRDRALAELLMRQREQAAVDEKAIDAYARSEYQAKPDRFKQPEEVQARHILLAVAKDGSDDAQVKAKAEQLLTELRGGADFAKLAKEYSADKGSAARGGDLGTFPRGKMVPEFDSALFALKKPGELAGPVKTAFGYHIIELEGIKPAQARPFDEVLPELRAEVKAKLQANERQSLWAAAQESAKVDEAAVKALAEANSASSAKP